MLAVSILALLTEHPPGLSDAALARGCGCTPDALAAAIRCLRAEGMELERSDGGWRLVRAAGWGAATLRWRVGRPVVYFPECGSTNRIARDLAQAVRPGDRLPVVVADHQTEGRGRRGRTWDAMAGKNLLFSMVLRPQVATARVPRLVLAWAAAMAEVLDVSLKWPNDLVVMRADRMWKVGGLLAELETVSAPSGRPPQPLVVLGVGINVSQVDFPGLPSATSLAALGREERDRAHLLGRLVAAVDGVDVHAPQLLDGWRARACMLGRRVRVGSVEGVADGVREDGALMVDGQVVLAGDVELVHGL